MVHLFTMNEVEKEIEKVILKQPVNLQSLRDISRRKGGFQNHSLRVRVWPKLMDVNRYDIDDFRQYVNDHKDNSQVMVDVERSLWNIEIVRFWRDSYRDRRRKALSDIIISILARNKSLHYYQGFHDVVSVFLLIFQDDHLAFAVSERVALSFLVDFMQRDFELVSQFMKIILLIIQLVDKELYEHFLEANMEPFFATSWLLTWFSHDLKDINEIARLFDVLLSSPPLYIYYLSAVYVISLRSKLLETEPDFAMIHSVLVRAPEKYGFPIEDLIHSADKLMQEVSVDRLKPLCEKSLVKLINSKKIMSIARPCFTRNKADSDWTLLENMRLVPVKTWGLPTSAFRTLWTYGWNLTFLTHSRMQTLEIQSQNKSTSSQLQRKRSALTPPKSSLAKRKYNHSSLANVVCGVFDELMYLLFVRYRNSLRSTSNSNISKRFVRVGLFWSITFAVSGTLMYSLWSHKMSQSCSSLNSMECPSS